MSQRRPARLARLAAVAGRLGADEVEVLLLIATRLAAGMATYGALALRRDRRAFQREALEEIADATFYLAVDLLRRRRRRSRA